MSNNPYARLRADILAEVLRMLKRWRLPAGQLDGQITINNMPPGTATPNPDGSGGLIYHLTATELFALLTEGDNVTITLTEPTVTIASTGAVAPGGSLTYSFLTDDDGYYITDDDGAYLVEPT